MYNSLIAHTTTPDNFSISELWLWIHRERCLLVAHIHLLTMLLPDSQRLITSPSPVIEGYNFAYQGLSGIWEGFKPVRPSPPSGQPTPRLPTRSTLFDGPTASPLLAPLSLEVPTRRPSSKNTGRKRSQVPASNLPEDFLAAIDELNARSGNSESAASWKPSVATGRLSQRRFALQLCGWSLAQDDLARAMRRWEKENKHSQAACWLVFTEQHKQAIDMLMRSKGMKPPFPRETVP